MIAADQLFQPANRRTTLPFRDRAHFSLCARIGPDVDGFAVYITSLTAAALRAGTRARAPDEAFGLLLGRAFADHIGTFTVVAGVVYAEPSECDASSGHVRVPVDAMGKLRARAEGSHPGLDLVGWTHSHTHDSMTQYSPTDLREQATWPEDYHVGLLTFMKGNEWVRAFRGPSAQVLLPLVVPIQVRRNDLAELFRPAAIPNGTAPPAAPPLQRPPVFIPAVPPGRTTAWLTGAVAVVAVLTLLLLLGWFDHRLEHLDQRLGEIAAQTAPVRPTSIAWSCAATDARVPLRVVCTAPVGPGIVGWLWAFGDTASATVPKTTHDYTQPGSYTVQLILFTSNGSMDAGIHEVILLGGPAERRGT